MTEQAISPLRRRMIEDMTIRKFAPKTQHDYVQRQGLAGDLKHSPDTAKPEDVRGFQLHLTSSGGGRGDDCARSLSTATPPTSSPLHRRRSPMTPAHALAMRSA
jgi:hypothetical protein